MGETDDDPFNSDFGYKAILDEGSDVQVRKTGVKGMYSDNNGCEN